jgi:hypothetical protein
MWPIMRNIQGIIVQVCSACGACEADIMAELTRLEQESVIPIQMCFEECLDTCDDEPSFSVDNISIAPASPVKLRRAVEMAMEQRGK